MFNVLKESLGKRKRFREWRKNNKHNSTVPGNSFAFDNVKVGRYTYGTLNVLSFNNSYKLKIGSYCSIASGVVFALSSDHRTDLLSTFPFKIKCFNSHDPEAVSKGDIIVNDDVWIGENAVILSGVKVGQGAVVAAGSVVSKDVPPYAIVGGVPAKVIKYRFTDEIIKELLQIDYSKWDLNFVSTHMEELYKPINSIEDVKWILNNGNN